MAELIDGQLSNDLNDAEIVLIGVSRTSKTPTSMYLANRGIRVANIPFVPEVSLPESIFKKKGLIIGLTTSTDRLIQIRKSRLNSVGEKKATNYIKEESIEQEVVSAKKVFLKKVLFKGPFKRFVIGPFKRFFLKVLLKGLF